jgi:hypothetical protein
MTAGQLTNPHSNVLTACPERSEGFKRSNAPTLHSSNLQSSIFNLQPLIVPQTTNQEHTPITSNYTRKHPFLAHQNGQKIFVPRKRLFLIFLLKNQGSILHLASSIFYRQPSTFNRWHLFLEKANSNNNSKQFPS